MKFNTTNGKEWNILDCCPYCQLDTDGSHQSTCLLFNKAPDQINNLTRLAVHIYNKSDGEIKTIRKIIETIAPEVMVYNLDEDKALE